MSPLLACSGNGLFLYLFGVLKRSGISMPPAAVTVKRLVVGCERSVASFVKVFNPDGSI